LSLVESNEATRGLGVVARDRDAAAMRSKRVHGRRDLVLRGLRAADAAGLTLAFFAATTFFTEAADGGSLSHLAQIGLFLLSLPLWIALASLYGLYSRDDVRADHSTADEVFGVVNLVTVGTWIVFAAGRATGVAAPELSSLISFWVLAIAGMVGGRALVRAVARSDVAYLQRAMILGAGDVGQLVARKITQHPEYKIEPDERTMALVRLLPLDDVIVDVVPRLFELIGPRATLHSIEGLPLVCLPPSHLARSALAVKRMIDIVGASFSLILVAPLFAYIALRIRLDSKGPVFFRQTRLGYGMRPFTVLKFRTMVANTDDAMHREYIKSTMKSSATLGESGMYKLDRDNEITSFGRWLRRTSLDELPQLVNVLRGEMSLVGPRPCIPYEAENFEPHHYERFLVPQGITGLWQVAARSSSTFGEALEMDVAYARGWSIGFDLRLLFRTPFAVLRQRRATT
jgi:lipopolysaccharide/colanic/teichoic acid biosynthesis glycosyltransferase